MHQSQKNKETDSKNAIVKTNNTPFFAPASIIQKKLEIGGGNDVYEVEADAIANRIINSDFGSVSPQSKTDVIQRKCTACEEEENIRKKPLAENITPLIQRHSLTSAEGGVASSQVENKINSSRGGGSLMDTSTQNFMESRFGADFSEVRIHTGSEAIQMNRELNAQAFTVGNDIYFNQGKYSPNTDTGKHLLAHELTHTIQQSNGIHRKIQRVCSAENRVEYDTIVSSIRQLPFYLRPPRHRDAIYTPRQAKSLADRIMREAVNRDNCVYYAQALHTLFSTTEESAASIGASQGPVLSQAAADESERLTNLSNAGQAGLADFEENLSSASTTHFQSLRGEGGTIYYVDSSDPANVIVKLKVKLTGNSTHVNHAKSLEDGIEKRASVHGYTVDLNFVNHTGRDVFQASVDPNAWATSGNWVGTPDVMAHELHHLLGLPDRYNYIEDHSGNAQMYICNRIHWFNEEFNRSTDPNQRTSIMGYGNLITDADVCQVIQAGDVPACMRSREALRQPAINARNQALQKMFRVKNIVAGIIPGILLNPHEPDTAGDAYAQRVRLIAQNVFGALPTDDEMTNTLYLMDYFLRPAQIQLMNTADSECLSNNTYIQVEPVRTIMICSGFSGLDADAKAKEMIKSGHLLYQNISGNFVMQRLRGIPADAATASKWADFVIQAYNSI